MASTHVDVSVPVDGKSSILRVAPVSIVSLPPWFSRSRFHFNRKP